MTVPAADPETAGRPAAPRFGTVYADRMAVAWYRAGAWSPHTIEPLEPLKLHPGAHVLHYGSSCFEGLKAFRQTDGELRVFRLASHLSRMARSAELLCLPLPPAGRLERMVVDTAAACRDATPAYPGALYLRPTLIGTEPSIGAAATASREACLYVLASPVGDYFEGGERPLRILVDDEASRSTPGFGMAKTGGNYASALRHIEAARRSCGTDQVLFCPGGDVQETGAANFLLIDDGEILTKPLDGSFLHGVTRSSVLELASRLGYRIDERGFRVPELLARLPRAEAALTGTAAVMAGVGTLIYRGAEHRVGDGSIGPNTRRLRRALQEIQSGMAPDPGGWLTTV